MDGSRSLFGDNTFAVNIDACRLGIELSFWLSSCVLSIADGSTWIAYNKNTGNCSCDFGSQSNAKRNCNHSSTVPTPRSENPWHSGVLNQRYSTYSEETVQPQTQQRKHQSTKASPIYHRKVTVIRVATAIMQVSIPGRGTTTFYNTTYHSICGICHRSVKIDEGLHDLHAAQ